MNEKQPIVRPQVRSEPERHNKFVSFLVTFGLLLIGAELVLRLIGWVQFNIGEAIALSDIPLTLVNITMAISNGIFTLVGLVMLFAFFEWRHLGFNNFRARYAEGLLYGLTALVIATVIQMLAYSGLRSFDIIPVVEADQFGPLLLICLLYTSPSPRDKRQSRMPSSA